MGGWRSQIKCKVAKGTRGRQSWGDGTPPLSQGIPASITQGEVPGPGALAPLGSLLKMQNPRSHPRPTIYPISQMGKLRHGKVKKLGLKSHS